MLEAIGTALSYTDLYSQAPPSLGQIKQFFASLNARAMVQLLSKMNIAVWRADVESGHRAQIDLQLHLARMLFSEEEFSQIKVAFKNNATSGKNLITIIHRQELLLALKIVLLEGDFSIQISELGIGHVAEIGKYLLALGDYASPPAPDSYGILPAIDYEYIRQEMARMLYFQHQTGLADNFARAITMWLEIPNSPEAQESTRLTAAQLYADFKAETGITLEEYLILSFIMMSRLLELNIYTDNPHDFMHHGNFWAETSLPREKGALLLKLLSVDLHGFRQAYGNTLEHALKSKDFFFNNFLTFVESPFLQLADDLYVVTDPLLLIERILTGPYFILLKCYGSSTPKGKDLSKWYGDIHQLYVEMVLRRVADQVIPVRTRPNRPTCDFICVFDTEHGLYLGAVQSKKIALKLQITMLSDRQSTLEGLSRIFGDKSLGEEDSSKGFAQVFSTIELMAEGKLDELRDLELNRIQLVFPLVIVDRFIPEEAFNRNLYEKEFFDPQLIKFWGATKFSVADSIFLASEDLDLIDTAVENKPDRHFLPKYLGHRHLALRKRAYIRQPIQFIKNMHIADVGWMVEDLYPVWTELALGNRGLKGNRRLKRVMTRYFNKYKRKLFPKTDRKVSDSSLS